MEAARYLQGLLAEKRALLGEKDSFWSSSYADAFSKIRRKSPILIGIVISTQIIQLNLKRRRLLCVINKIKNYKKKKTKKKRRSKQRNTGNWTNLDEMRYATLATL